MTTPVILRGQGAPVVRQSAPSPVVLKRESTTAVIVPGPRAAVVVAVAKQGPPGPPGAIGPSGGSALTVTAGTAIGGHRVVYLDGAGQAQYADCSVLSLAAIVLGITTGAAAQGDVLDVLRLGPIDESSWAWTLNQPVYLGLGGLLTQTLPPTAAFSLVVGFPITPTRIFVSVREPIILS